MYNDNFNALLNVLHTVITHKHPGGSARRGRLCEISQKSVLQSLYIVHLEASCLLRNFTSTDAAAPGTAEMVDSMERVEDQILKSQHANHFTMYNDNSAHFEEISSAPRLPSSWVILGAKFPKSQHYSHYT